MSLSPGRSLYGRLRPAPCATSDTANEPERGTRDPGPRPGSGRGRRGAGRARRHGRRDGVVGPAGGAAAGVPGVGQPERGRPPHTRALPRGAREPALRHGPPQLARARCVDGRAEHRHRPAAGLGGEPHRRAGPAVRARHGPHRLRHAALPDRDRLREPVQSQRRPREPLDAGRARRARAHLQRVLDVGPGAGDRAPHVSVRVPAGRQRAGVGGRVDGRVGADPGRRPLAHGGRRSPGPWWRRQCCRAR